MMEQWRVAERGERTAKQMRAAHVLPDRCAPYIEARQQMKVLNVLEGRVEEGQRGRKSK